jgi:hypothetical protein
MKLINLCRHQVNIATPEGEIILPAHPVDYRVSCEYSTQRTIEVEGKTINLVVPVFGEISPPLPPEEEGTMYVVSIVLATHPSVAARKDLVSPGFRNVREKGANAPSEGLQVNFR